MLTDDPIASPRADHRLVLPAGTAIGPRERLVIERGANGFPFGVSCGDDTIRLADAASGGTLVDEVAVPVLTVGSDTFGRHPDTTGPWVQTASTKGAPNEPSTASGAPPADPAWLFDPGTVHTIELTLPPASRDALAVTPDEYVDGTFTLGGPDGTHGPYAVGVRLKGMGSFRGLDGKAAFKIKFDHSVAGQRFHGLEKLTLNNMVQDPSMLHETLSYEAFRAMGVAAPRTGFAQVRVNGELFGLYLNVETVDRAALARWSLTTRHLYEGTYGDDVRPDGAFRFEVDEGSDTNRDDLEALIAAVNSDGAGFSERLTGLADLAQMTRMWATERYVGQWDGYTLGWHVTNNFYLHSDAGGVFRMLPWGLDQSLVHRVHYGGGGGLLFVRCLDDPPCRSLYADAVAQARATIAGLGLADRATAIAAVLAPWQAADPRREHTLEEIAAAVDATREFLLQRPGDTRWEPEQAQTLDERAPATADVPADVPAEPGETAVPVPSVIELPASKEPAASPLVSAVALLARRFEGADPRRIARSPQRLTLALEQAGSVRLVWRALRRGRPVTIAQGSATRSAPGRARVRMRLTRTGGRLLRRARRVRVTLVATFRPRLGGDALAARESFVLRRSPQPKPRR